MAKRVRVIPATLDMYDSTPIFEKKKRRVAGYARVSTAQEEQALSYETQMAYYKNYILSNDDWIFVDMYSDEGISATNTKHRNGFNQMIADALAGKIDLIVTKSVSRFARNTVDSLSTIRKLKDKGIEVYFEKENIWTLDAKGELMITIMSSLAQEESRSISENTTWGKRKQFAKGEFGMSFKSFLGYDEGFKINEEQAKVVKLIYKLFLSGLSCGAIARELEKREIKAPAGGNRWYNTTVKSILTNEKYKGDALLQKNYTADFLSKAKKVNTGEVPQYYVENHHEAIIDPDVFDLVQTEMEKRVTKKDYSGVNIFSSKIRCGECGGWYGAKVWHSNSKYRRVVYQCNHKYDKGRDEPCSTPHISEDEIKFIFVQAVEKLSKYKKEVMENMRLLMDTACDVSGIEKKIEIENEKLECLIHKLDTLIETNAVVAMDQEEYRLKENELRKKYEKLFVYVESLNSELEEKENRRRSIRMFINKIDTLPENQIQFSEELWISLIDHIVINKDGNHQVIFRGGLPVNVK